MANLDVLEVLDAERRPADFGARRYFLNAPFDQVDSTAVVELLANANRNSRFRYVVTPNADHVVRLNRDPALRPYYEDAWLTLCDSKPISLFAHARSREMTHVTGSDLTASLFKSVIQKGDRIALIVGAEKVGEDVRAAYPGVDFRIHTPPMGLWRNAQAQQDCVDFALQQQGRFTFIAVGAPQSEKIAYMLSRQPGAVGVGLCVGASLEFLIGSKSRAPLWMQKFSLEWLYRMFVDPKRLWRRYVYGAPPLLMLFMQEIRGRNPNAKVAGISSHR